MSIFRITRSPDEFQGAHVVGDPHCKACEGHSCFGEFPKACPCGGLIHSDGDDEEPGGGAFFTTSECDLCKKALDLAG